MKKYFIVFLAMANISTKRYLEQRWNTFGAILFSTVTFIATLIFISIFFRFTHSINGWSSGEVILLTGIYRLISVIAGLFFIRSLYFVPQLIQKGELDIYLTKPVNSQFFLSLRLVRTYEILNVFAALMVIIYALSNLSITFNFFSWILLVIGLFSGLILIYSIFFLLATLAIWMGKFTALSEVYLILSNLFSIPTDFYGRSVVLIFGTILPLAFIVTIPTKVFLNKLNPFIVILSIIISVISLYISHIFWNYSLRHYTSASS